MTYFQTQRQYDAFLVTLLPYFPTVISKLPIVLNDSHFIDVAKDMALCTEGHERLCRDADEKLCRLRSRIEQKFRCVTYDFIHDWYMHLFQTLDLRPVAIKLLHRGKISITDKALSTVLYRFLNKNQIA